jgi:hypothetical protein
MPKQVSDYQLQDWFRLRPLLHAWKTLRYRLINHLYVRRPPRAGDATLLAGAIKGRDVLVSIAFSDPQIIRWQAILVRHYVPNALYVIADNSADDRSAAQISRFAEQQGVPYLRLPTNPWGIGSRSHGEAMNWVWHNLLRPGEPKAFGFLDHDLFPTAPDDPFAALATQDFYGVIRRAGDKWFLWAGFCMFRFGKLREIPVNFGQDWFIGLDTGGGNWSVLYRDVDPSHLHRVTSRFVPCKPSVNVNEAPLQWCGTWLHEVGLMGNPALRADKRDIVADILAPHLRAAEPVAKDGAEGNGAAPLAATSRTTA